MTPRVPNPVAVADFSRDDCGNVGAKEQSTRSDASERPQTTSDSPRALRTRPSLDLQKQTAGNPLRRVTLREALATLGEHDRARALVMGRFKALGGELDHVDGVRAHRVRLVDALTFAEDRIELADAGHARAFDRSADRQALRALRRRLELELWP